jgi:hypothetical protein
MPYKFQGIIALRSRNVKALPQIICRSGVIYNKKMDPAADHGGSLIEPIENHTVNQANYF